MNIAHIDVVRVINQQPMSGNIKKPLQVHIWHSKREDGGRNSGKP